MVGKAQPQVIEKITVGKKWKSRDESWWTMSPCSSNLSDKVWLGHGAAGEGVNHKRYCIPDWEESGSSHVQQGAQMNCLLLLFILVLRHGLSNSPFKLLGYIISSLLVWWDSNNFIVSSKNYQFFFSQSDLYKIKMQPHHSSFWPFYNIFTLAKLLFINLGPFYPVLGATVSHVTV